MHSMFATRAASARPIWFVTDATYASVRSRLGSRVAAFAAAAGFEPKPGRHVIVPGVEAGDIAVLFGLEPAAAADKDPFLPGRLPNLLPEGVFRFANAPHDARLGALAFALGAYRFTRYRTGKKSKVRLLPPVGLDVRELSHIIEGVELTRDLVNTPSNDMGPDELEAAARALARKHGARVRSIVGKDLLKKNFPLIHAVGRASTRAPRLIDLAWGSPKHPKLTIVGKGVCFDSGGLDIKPEGPMLLMKKDMGGAATALGLAHMIMASGLKVRLRVLVPAVENAISGAAFRPLDVYPSRKGLTVEVGNTDAEGRLVLADALAAGDEDKPDLMIDLGTLTGAARVALGPDLPPFYTASDELAHALARCAAVENDPLWQMPLWSRYDRLLESKVADLNNVASGNFAGSIICALFLRRFVCAARTWLHLDIYAWNPSERPGRPEGGECQAARALFALMKQRYA